jgi:hypothetical protein
VIGLQEIADVILPACAAAYIAMDPAASVPLAPGYNLVGRIHAAGEPKHPTAVKAMKESWIFGFVAVNSAELTALISIRGTQYPIEWLEDFEAFPLPFSSRPGFGLVHGGFDAVYGHIRASIESLLASQFREGPPTARIIVTGHSLGGGLTTLVGLDYQGTVMEICNVAAPRALTPDSLGHFKVTCTRLVNKFDLVPNVPLPPIYEHTGVEVLVDSGGSLEPRDRHGLIAYAAGLKSKMGVPK